MKNAQILVLPSTWYEGFPMIVAEAYAVGLPIIASSLGSLSSLVVHGHTGRQFQPGNDADLRAQVEWVLLILKNSFECAETHGKNST